jgi:hypothetical protein
MIKHSTRETQLVAEQNTPRHLIKVAPYCMSCVRVQCGLDRQSQVVSNVLIEITPSKKGLAFVDEKQAH